MKIPGWLYRLLFNLHITSKTIICLRNLLILAIVIACGVKQGDPSAMTMFILAYDPIIKFIVSRFAVGSISCYGYCDDLGFASGDLPRDWNIIKKCFILIKKFSLLELNLDKNQFHLTCKPDLANQIYKLKEADSEIADNQIVEAIRYLGIFLGRCTAETNWDLPLKKFIDATLSIANLNCGFNTSIALYNMLAVSKLSYIATFFTPSQKVLKAEKWALQKLIRGPWGAIPSLAIFDTKLIGLPNQARALADVSFSSAVRAANLTSKNFYEEFGRHRDLLKSNDITIAAAAGINFKNSFLKHWNDASVSYIDTIMPCNNLFNPSLFSQRRVYKNSRSRATPYNFNELICKRLSFFLDGTFSHVDAERIVGIYKRKALSLGPNFVSTHFRTLTNHWCSRSRFGCVRIPCWFCKKIDHSSNDRVQHSITCPVFKEVFISLHNLCYSFFDLYSLLIFMHDGESLSDNATDIMLFYNIVSFQTYNRCRNGADFSVRLVRNVIKNIVTKSSKAWCLHYRIKKYGYGPELLA